MMADRTKGKSENWGGNTNYQARWRQKSSNRRPPPHGDAPTSVPAWEKRFCASIGRVQWGKLLEAKSYMHLYKNVISWEDSGCEEAFKNAKSRFWAEMKGLPCDLKLPDPDIYIDKIDWEVNIDPELILDLERDPDVQKERPIPQDEGNILISGKPLASREQLLSCNTLDAEPKGGATGLLLSSHLGPKVSNFHENQGNGWENSNGLSWGDNNGYDGKGDWDEPKRGWNGWGDDDDGWRDPNLQGKDSGPLGGGQWEDWNVNKEQYMSSGWNRSNVYTGNGWGDNCETDGAKVGWHSASRGTGGWCNDYRTPKNRGNAYQMGRGRGRGRKGGNRGGMKRFDPGHNQPSWVDDKLAASRQW